MVSVFPILSQLSKRGIDCLAGGLLLAFVIVTLVAVAVDPIAEPSARDKTGDILQDIAGDRDRVITSISFDVAGNFLIILFAGALYMAFRAHDRTLALLGTSGYLASGVLFLVADMTYISLESLSQDYVAVSGAQADSVLSTANAIAVLADGAVIMGATLLAIGILSYGGLVMRTAVLPRWIGALGIIGGIVIPFGWLTFADGDLFTIAFIGLLIGLVFALAVGSWMVLKGTSEASSSVAVGPTSE